MKSAYVLIGGGAKGAFQFGCLEIAHEFIKPDLIIGTSIGAINGAILSAYEDVTSGIEALDELWRKVDRHTFFPYNARMLLNFAAISSISTQDNLKKILKGIIEEDDFGKLKLPFYANTVDFFTGKNTFINEGSVIDAVLASSAFIPLYAPVKIGRKYYIDGGFGAESGISKAVSLGATQILVINPNNFFQREGDTLTDKAGQVFENTMCLFIDRELKKARHKDVEIIEINIDAPEYDRQVLDFSHTRELIAYGRKKASHALEEHFKQKI